MSDTPYTKVSQDDVELRERKGGGAGSRDLSGALETEHMKIRIWHYEPGNEMAYHRHQSQEEVYNLISGGPQTLQVGDEDIVVNDGDWIALPKDTPRRIKNTGSASQWLTIGAPPGTGITDGIRLDPETGEEIPRT